MADPFSELLKNISSKGDWAVVVPAGLIGFAIDAAINIIPLPIFSPGVCGLGAAGAALSVKRGIEARQEVARNRKLLALAIRESTKLAEALHKQGFIKLAGELDFETLNAKVGGDLGALLAAIRAARNALPERREEQT